MSNQQDEASLHRSPGSDAETPQDIPRQGWLQILKRAWAQTTEDQVPLLGAGVAFFGFLALFPSLIALVLAYGLFADPGTIATQIDSLGSALPAEVKTLIIDQLTAQSAKSGALSIGVVVSLLVALWSASGGVANLVQAVNTAYDETDDRNIVKKRLVALGLTFGACTNVYSPSDATVVSVDHGCGAHSSVPQEDRAEELPAPVWETIEWDEPVSLFD